MKTLTIALITTCLAAPALAQDAARGAVLFQTHCAVCHGAAAMGDGPMAEVLTVTVPDLTALGKEGPFPVLDVVMQIDGRAEVLAHGGTMPVFGDWFEGDGADVALSGPGGQPILVSRPIADLVAYLEEVQS